MNRLLILMLLALAAYWGLHLGWRLLASTWRQIEGDTPPSGGPERGTGRKGRVAELVPCAVCGVHVPRERALGTTSAFYCSDACRSRA